MRHLFGTDGMRGVAGQPPLDAPTLFALGHAVATQMLRSRGRAQIALGMDTRESCGWIAGALAAGVRAAGGSLVSAGVLPTPGLALITRRGGYDAGLMVSASHNPYLDNGVKVFDASGSKLLDSAEIELESLMSETTAPEGFDAVAEAARVVVDPALHEMYLAFLDECREGVRFDGVTVVLDTAHGAAYRIADEAFKRAGAHTIVLGDAPNGHNINDAHGSMHPEVVARTVRERGAAMGFAFDGDADRCIAASGSGKVLDGDFMLLYCGRALQRAGNLPGRTVVATVMSNLGLQKALEHEKIKMKRAPVGDRYVLEEMKKGGFTLGGEQSGHVIFMHYAPTGDGVLTALTMTKLWKQGAGDFDTALASIPHFPQVLKNIQVREKPPIESHPALAAAVRRAEKQMGGEGRVVIRYSGTEPKARVMIEGPDAALVERLVNEVCDVFKREIGL